MFKRLHITVHGRVQGVFFRTSSQKRAIELGLTGFVRNDAGGSVSILAQGPEERLQALLDWCYTGPRWSKVEQVKFKWQEATEEFKDFEIR